jgi:O-acetyl-ADP-ribose deacetylase (regulator of RNase III)
MSLSLLLNILDLFIMNLIIFDITDKFINEAKSLKKYGITVIKIDVNDLVNKYNITALVSPANSFGYMNGGIDNIYSQMFPGIQQQVQHIISAPTMFLPGSISNTNNIYNAFLAILQITVNNPNATIACPGLGTGVGQMDPKQVINHIEMAIRDFSGGNLNSSNYKQNILYSDKANIVIK